MTTGLREFTRTTADGSGHQQQPILDTEQGEKLMHVQPNVAIVLGNFPPISPGTLYVTNKQVVWLSEVDRDKGYAVNFYSMSLHAVSRDPEAYPSPCIYTQIETGADENEHEESDAQSNEASEISRITEMRLVPQILASVYCMDTLFEIFCECAELNPEPIEEEDENNRVLSADQLEDEAAEGDDHEWQSSQNRNSIGHSNGNSELAHSVLELHINDDRFEDAEEMDHERNGQL